jgi:hypothetical protein
VTKALALLAAAVAIFFGCLPALFVLGALLVEIAGRIIDRAGRLLR